MNSRLNYFYFLVGIMFILLTTQVLSLSASNLKSYYAFNTYDSIGAVDQQGIQSLQVNSINYTNGTGLFMLDYSAAIPSQLTGRYWNYTSTIFNSPFSINMWVYFTEYTNQQYFILVQNTTSIKTYKYVDIIPTSSVAAYRLQVNGVSNMNTTVNVQTNAWNMLTLTYDGSTFRAYLNGQYTNSFSATWTDLKYFFIYQPYPSKIDEVSIWTTTLSLSDEQELYNIGTGLTYSQILDWNPTNNSISYYDICIGNWLCHNLTITNDAPSCPITQNGIMNYIPCVTGNCYDNQTYWGNLGLNPPYNNFTGSCGLCTNACNQENTTQCNGNALQTCHLSNNGCYQWYTTACQTNYICQSGICQAYTNPPSTPSNTTNDLGITTQNNVDMWCPFFNIQCQNSTSQQLLVALLITLVSACLGLALIAALTTYAGNIPSSLIILIESVFIILPYFYFVTIGFFPFWTFTLLVIIIALLLGGIITSKVISTGG